MLERFKGAEGKRRLVEALRAQRVIGDNGDLAKAVADSARVQRFEPDSVLIHDMDVGNDVYFILSGVVSIRVMEREVAVRTAGQHIGEMALLDPGQPRSASAVAVDGEVVAARLSESDFNFIAESNPRLWRNVARELAGRLRQRNRFIAKPNPRPVLFLGCSTESLTVTRAIQMGLEHDPIVVKVWTDEVFTPSMFAIESLENQLASTDFAALVLSPDDMVVSRNVTSGAPRDNVIFELGLFMGALGHSRVFLVYPREVEVKIPTDLAGITALTYPPALAGELRHEVASVCYDIRRVILSEGPR